MTKRERGYISLLKERCGVLRARIGERAGTLDYIRNIEQELAAMEWAVRTLEEATERDYETP